MATSTTNVPTPVVLFSVGVNPNPEFLAYLRAITLPSIDVRSEARVVDPQLQHYYGITHTVALCSTIFRDICYIHWNGHVSRDLSAFYASFANPSYVVELHRPGRNGVAAHSITVHANRGLVQLFATDSLALRASVMDPRDAKFFEFHVERTTTYH